MKSYKISKGLAVFIAIAGVSVMAGWIFDIGVLKSILPMWINMKFSTALCFLLSGVAVYLIAKFQERKSVAAQVILPLVSLILLLFMASFLVSSFLGVRLGIEDLFIKEAPQEMFVKDWIPGKPSVVTMLAFIMIAIAGILTMLNVTNLKSKLLFLGGIITILGGSAVAGYLMNVPFLRYDIKGWSNPMAAHTSILFVLIGLSLILLGRKKSEG
ncbi:MAG: hypothetical protein ABH891_00895 [Candidatus Omnitrophota bacterium]